MHPVYMYTKYKCSVSSCTQVYSYFFKYWACDVDMSHSRVYMYTKYTCIHSIHFQSSRIQVCTYFFRYWVCVDDISCTLYICIQSIHIFNHHVYRFIRISLDIGCVLTIYHVPCMCQKFSNADFSSIFDRL